MSLRREALTAGALMLGAFVLRVIFVLAMEAHPAHQVPVLDSAFHVEWARAIAAHQEYAPLAGKPFFRAPLYAWFLAAIFRLFGDGLLLPRLIQCALGAASVGLAYAIGRRAFDARAAFVAASLAATYWLLIYFDGELMSESLVVFLTLGSLWLTLRLSDTPRNLRAAGAGIAWGLTALARPNVLLFMPFVPLWLLWSRRPRVLSGFVPAVLFGVGVLAPILPVTAYNTFAKGDFSLIASYGGVNLWLGNNPDANGIDAWMPGSRRGWWEGYYDAIALAERAVGRPLRASEVSRYYSARAWDFIWNDPGRSLPLLGRKLVLFWAGEYGNNEPETFVARHYSWVPRLSIGYALLAPLGLLGIAVARRSATRLFPLWGFLVVYMVSVVMFLVASRYRVPVLPVLMVYAGAALVWLWDRLRARAWAPLCFALCFLAGFASWALTQGPAPSTVQVNGHLSLGTSEAARGNHRAAAAHLRRANQLGPNRIDVLSRLAWSERQIGEHDAAIAHYRQALNLAPENSEVLEALLDLALAEGRSAEAEQWIDAYLVNAPRWGIEPASPVALYYRGRIRAERGEWDLARDDFKAVLSTLSRNAPSRDDDRAYAGLVDVLVRQSRNQEACEQATAWHTRRPRNAAASEARARHCASG